MSRASNGAALWIGLCQTCGKRSYPSKREARRARGQVAGHDSRHLSVYRCGDWWHIGHLPRMIVRGDAARGELRGRAR